MTRDEMFQEFSDHIDCWKDMSNEAAQAALDLIEQQAATIARLSAPFDLYQWERHEFAGTAQTFDTVIQERLHGE